MINPFRQTQTLTHRKYIRAIICIVYFLLGVNYIYWRPNIFNPEAILFSYLFYIAELFGFILSFAIIFIGWNLKLRKPSAPPQGLAVDVFITTYNEPIEVIRRTLVGAVRIKYPHTTWLLDDGNREEIKKLAAEIGCNYLARENNLNAKAGNLNNGLKHSNGDYVAIFDADHVAEPDFLHKTLGYFKDPLLSIVQTPQDYYNTDAFQFGRHKDSQFIWHDQSWFNYIGQTGRDYWNSATLCGSSAVIRRYMLDEIGGFPVETVTEDMHCAVRLQKKGYKTIYHPEPLAYGIAPVDLDGYLKQRLRWGEGNLQVCREENLPFTRLLTLQQRLSYFFLTTNYLAAWQKLFYYITPIYVLFTQSSPLLTDPLEFFIYFVPYMLMGILLIEEIGRGYGRYMATDLYAMAQVVIGIGATFGLVRKKIKFQVTSKLLNGKLSFYLLSPYITVFLVSILAVAYTIIRYIFNYDVAMPFGVALLLILFALINSFFALLVIRNAYRCSRLSDKEFKFEIPLIGAIQKKQNEFFLIEEISSSELIFYSSSRMNPNELIDGKIFLPLKTLPILFSVSSFSEYECENKDMSVFKYNCKFEWRDLSFKDELDIALISCKWHRLILKKYETIKTPFDYLCGMLFSENNRDHDFNRPVLYKLPDDKEHKLAYISNDGVSVMQLFVFEKITSYRHIEIIDMSDLIIKNKGYSINHNETMNIIDDREFQGAFFEKLIIEES